MSGPRLAVAALALCVGFAAPAHARSERMTVAAAKTFERQLTAAGPKDSCELLKPCVLEDAKRTRKQAKLARAKAATLAPGACTRGLATAARNYERFASAETTYYRSKGKNGTKAMNRAGKALADFFFHRFRDDCVRR